MKQISFILVVFLILLSLVPTASADVTLIFTEPLLKGNTEMRVFYAANSSLLGSITTNASELTLDEGQSYIIQVLPVGISFANDPMAAIEYAERGTPAIFTIAMGLLTAACLASIMFYFFLPGKKKKR